MAWWEGKLKDELRKLPPAEIERIVGDAINGIDNDRYMAMARAMKREAIERGLIQERQRA